MDNIDKSREEILKKVQNLCLHDRELSKDSFSLHIIGLTIQKQMARKVVFHTEEKWSTEGMCPTCDSNLIHNQIMHCQNCGQKLDWGD